MGTDDQTKSLDDVDPDASGAPTPRSSERVDGPAIAPGTCIGRFTIRERIGVGGMGEVFSAHDPELDRVVALKVLRRDVGGQSLQARARFQREAQAMARLNHPNVVSVYEVGTFGEQVFVVMELVHGPTLAAWLAEKPRGWRDVVAIFLQAGQGLAAAHRAGIIHRDFKPSNVILGDRVRVADFGLARAAGEPSAASSSAPTMLDEGDVTRTGQTLGTPAYMAPEQAAGVAVTPKADQYSFALALREGLAPRRHPAWLKGIVDRGLKARPEDRYPSMPALLADLGRDPGRTARRWLLATAVVGLVAGGLLARREMTAPPCGNDEALVAPLWNDATRGRVEAAFLATGKLNAADIFQRVDATLRQRLDGWTLAHHDACAATHERHDQSEALLDLRMQCLGRARDDAATLVKLLGEADAKAVDRSQAAVLLVADPAPCADVAALTAIVPPPRDPEAIRGDAEVRLEAGRVMALWRLGRGKEALEASKTLIARAQALGQKTALSEALYATAYVEGEASNYDDAIGHAYAGIAAAENAHDDARRAEELTMLVFLLGYRQHHFAEAQALARVAAAAIGRAGDPPHLLDLLAHREGAVLEAKGDYTGALGRYVAELGLAIRDTGWSSRNVELALADLADVERSLGNLPAARHAGQQALQIIEALVGPDHPWLTVPLNVVANSAYQDGDLDAAAGAFERSIVILEKAYGPDHDSIGINAIDLAEIRILQDRLDDADALVERALRIFGRGGQEPTSYDLLAMELKARVQARRGELDAALATIERSLDLRTKLDGPEAELTGQALGNLGDIQGRRGQLPEAHATLDRAIAIFAKAFGPDSGRTAGLILSLAEVETAQGQGRAAVALCDKALPVLEKETGSGSVYVVSRLDVCANAHLTVGSTATARAMAERADRTARERNLMPSLQAEARATHAVTLLAQDPAQACRLGGEVRAIDAKIKYSNRRAEHDRWLAKHCPATRPRGGRGSL